MWDYDYRCRESWSEMELEYLRNDCKVFGVNTFTPLGKCLSIIASFYRRGYTMAKYLRHDRHTVSLLTDHMMFSSKYRGNSGW
jgi:hypothetical protein